MNIGTIFMNIKTKEELLDSNYLKTLTQVVTPSYFVVCRK